MQMSVSVPAAHQACLAPTEWSESPTLDRSPRRLSHHLTFETSCRIVKRMANQVADIDRLLHALADPTRRRIVERLGSGPASVSVLAAPLPMSLPAVVQHLQVLESCGLVASEKVGRVRTCRLELERLDTVQDWIAARRRVWQRRPDRLGHALTADAALPTTDTTQTKESSTPTSPAER
jgi:DNA-binding transcriptional ArsR family regulator